MSSALSSFPRRIGLLVIFTALFFAPSDWSPAVGFLHAAIAALVVLNGIEEWLERPAKDRPRVALPMELRHDDVPSASSHTLNKRIE